ncbi:MAG: amino acid adenylation domain-containing protein [Deltaproteobacteria bacterium]|nr:amino acid adenylation domain-containing protein [Deltaproteobacteria bacterium]
MRSFVDDFRARVEHRPENLACTFLAQGEEIEAQLSYGQLDRRAAAVAHGLGQSLKRGERALLLFPPGLAFVEAFLGCLYAGVVAVPAYPPRRAAAIDRLSTVFQDAAASAILTTPELDLRLRRWLSGEPSLSQAPRLTLQELVEKEGPRRRLPAVRLEDPAFLQYTSGSTSDPKGVVVSHSSLAANEQCIRQAFGQDERSIVVGWLPLYHDMGLIGNLLQPLYVGGHTLLMAPTAFLQRPARWLEAISRFRASTSGGPDFGYALCCSRVSDSEAEALDLSSWRLAFSGAEPVRASTLDRFARRFAPYGFRRRSFFPCYGLAEATLFASGGRSGTKSPRSDGPRVLEVDPEALELRHRAVKAVPGTGRPLVSCGQPATGHEVVVVEPQTHRALDPGQVGEIWFRGPSVAKGYWQRPEASSEIFSARLAPGAKPYLRTGDLGFLSQDDLFVTGRQKDLLVLRGRNHYPQDLEATAEESHPALVPGGGAAFAIEQSGSEALVMAHEIHRRREREALEALDAIRLAVSREHRVEIHRVVALRAGTLPRTTSGKVRRGPCRDALLGGELVVLETSEKKDDWCFEPPTSADTGLTEGAQDLRSFLQSRLAGALGIPIERVTAESPEVRLDSLAAVELANAVESRFGVPLPLSLLARGCRLDDLVAAAADPSAAAPAPPSRDEGARGPTSYHQQSLWLLARLHPRSTAYHVVFRARFRTLPHTPSLARALQASVDRHSALRTTFEETPSGKLHQVVAPSGPAHLTTTDLSRLSPEDRRGVVDEEALRPFDLRRGPLLRVRLFETDGSGPELLLTAHHIVMDLWSMTLLLEELGQLYQGFQRGEGTPLPLPKVTPVGHARWQRQRLQGDLGTALEKSWRQRLEFPPPPLELPADRPGTPHGEAAAGHLLHFGQERSNRLRSLANQCHVSLFTALLAFWGGWLSRLCPQDRLLVGAPAAGRRPQELEGLISHLANPLPILVDARGQPTAETLLARTGKEVLAALDVQEFPFSLLVQRLAPQRDGARQPLFQVAMALEQPPRLRGPGLAPFILGQEGGSLHLGGLELESLPRGPRATPFDLTLLVTDTARGLEAVLEARLNRFDPTTSKRLGEQWLTWMDCALEKPRRAIGTLPSWTPAQWQQLCYESNDTARSPSGKTVIHRLLTAARRGPEAVAVELGRQRLTYGQLVDRATRLSHALRRHGVVPEEPVALCMERSPEQIVALLAIWLAGGAYLPLDPSFPPPRLAALASSARSRRVLCPSALAPRLRGVELERLDPAELIAEGDPRIELALPVPDQLAYILFTSGSTGPPKGVAVSHGNILRLVRDVCCTGSGPDQVYLHLAPLAFDASTFEIWGALANGYRLVLLPPGVPSAADLAQAIREHQVTTLFLTTGLFNLLSDHRIEALSGLRRLLTGGEVLSAARARRALKSPNAPALFNVYGPTESTTFSSSMPLCSNSPLEPKRIGYPLSETTLWVVDEHMRPLPLGAPGELLVGGNGLARGYYRRPAATARSFVPHPWGHGERLYRTGDRASRHASGAVDFLGRMDRQIKVRGFRVEPGEVEAVLCANRAVKEAVVVPRTGPEGSLRLAAYVVWEPGIETPRVAAGGGENGEGQRRTLLRQWLQDRLPSAFQPSWLMTLAKLPLTASGKIDRPALPSPEPTPSHRTSLPRGELERLIAESWQRRLEVATVGADDNFFEIGGHSLALAHVAADLEKALEVPIPLMALFDHPTVSSLARHLRRNSKEDHHLVGAEKRAAGRRRAMKRKRMERRQEKLVAAINHGSKP